MRLSGVDPGIIRELSGIYKPFVKAFKELISNAYDADARLITVTLAPDFGSISVDDDGQGMTPFEFYNDFARLGGSTARLRGGKSPRGRDRIGHKGIGFLAVARYCSRLRIETITTREYRHTQVFADRDRRKHELFLSAQLNELIPSTLLEGRIAVVHVREVVAEKKTQLRRGVDYELRPMSVHLTSRRARTAPTIEVEYDLDCRGLQLKATLDFDHLLGLEQRADLRLIDDFCSVHLEQVPPAPRAHTRISLEGLKEFVVRELSAPAAKGKARNIGFRSGKDQFLWRLARSCPIRDQIPVDVLSARLQELRSLQEPMDLPVLRVSWRGGAPHTIERPIYTPKDASKDLDDVAIPVNIDEAGLRVVGYILPRSEVIFPAELRGISIRVRNVAIGDASYLGWEAMASGPAKAALSQVTGELMVLRGLDASDAINPGRESFYEESPHYRILRRTLFGSEETLGGLVGQAVRVILGRIHVRSQVHERITVARQRRKTLVDISSAVNHYARSDLPWSAGLNGFFERALTADGLATCRDVPLRPKHQLAGFELAPSPDAIADFDIDFRDRKVYINFAHDAWNTSIYMNGFYYDVVLKQGKPEHPICEFDNKQRKIYVNWAHPVKLGMDDVGFLKSAILLRLAQHAAPDDADTMMALALNMLSFRAE